MRWPDFFIVGAPKSGTTAIYEYLRQHPMLFLPERKELRYFAADLGVRHRLNLDRDAYLRHFSAAAPHQKIGTAYVWYLFSETAAAEIRDCVPDARILVLLRNPVDVLYSLHSEFLYNGNEDIASFEEALDASEARRAGHRIPAEAHFPRGLDYLSTVRFSDQLTRYLDAFGRDRVHATVFDDLAADPADTCAAILGFLGVQLDPGMSLDRVNPNKRVRSGALRGLLSNPPAWTRSVARALVPPRARSRLYARAVRLNTRTEPRPPLSPVLRRRLTQALAPEIERLGRLIGRDLTAWTADVDAGS